MFSHHLKIYKWQIIWHSNGMTVFLVINFTSSGAMSISSETNEQPIVFDFFSFAFWH